MENEKTNSKGKNILIVLLLLISIASLGFIAYDKLLTKENTNTEEKEKKTEEKEDTIEDNKGENKDNQEELGKCPFESFSGEFDLTDEDVNTILDSLESLNAGFTRDSINMESIEKHVKPNNDNTYIFNFHFQDERNNPLFAQVVKVNGKYKVVLAGSGTTIEAEKTKKNLMDRICS